MLMLIVRIYAATVAVTLLTQMLATARAQINDIPLGDDELLHTIILAALPLLNLVIAFDNLTMLFSGRTKFILNLECADDKFVDVATFLMALNTMKDAVVLAAILYNIFLK